MGAKLDSPVVLPAKPQETVPLQTPTALAACSARTTGGPSVQELLASLGEESTRYQQTAGLHRPQMETWLQALRPEENPAIPMQRGSDPAGLLQSVAAVESKQVPLPRRAESLESPMSSRNRNSSDFVEGSLQRG